MICPYCRGGVRDGAEKCWHCGAELKDNPITGSAGTPGGVPRPPAKPTEPPVQPPAATPEPPPEQAPEQTLQPEKAGQQMGQSPPEQGMTGEPEITTLTDNEKTQYVVVEGYNNNDSLDLDHIKYLLFSSEGRINRSRYWVGSIINTLLVWVLSFVAYFISIWLMLLVMISFVYPGLMLMIKRAHDRDRSGNFIWLMCVPIVSIWPAFELAFIRGTRGPNQFGPDPL